MQARMQCAFMAQNEEDANQRHRDMRMMMLTKQIESTERLIEFKMKMSERMGLDLFDGINNLNKGKVVSQVRHLRIVLTSEELGMEQVNFKFL